MKPTPVEIDSSFSFGASSRSYSLRERPQIPNEALMEDEQSSEGTLLGLPDDEGKLDDLTEFNTAHNKRISMVGITEETISNAAARKRKRHPSVSFNEGEEIINPEDVDPDVGKFRNMVQSTIVAPRKRVFVTSTFSFMSDSHSPTSTIVSPASKTPRSPTSFFSSVTVNPAPDIPLTPVSVTAAPLPVPTPVFAEELADVKPRKKYAKEAWPGKKPSAGRLI
jgi:nuclear inhibitor of protein phosphatase 1